GRRLPRFLTTFKNPCTTRFDRILAHFRSDPEVCGLDESRSQNLSTTVRTLHRLLQNVIRHDARICLMNEINQAIERNLSAFRIAVLAEFNQPLRFAESSRVNERDVMLFRRGIEEVARHGALLHIAW